MDSSDLTFSEQELIPAIVQNATSGKVLMLAWMNQAAFELTVASGVAHFWSRSRQTLWMKGETSGNRLHIKAIKSDCDRDALLLLVDPLGPTCHTGRESCFYHRWEGNDE